jgi:hypothetical protein
VESKLGPLDTSATEWPIVPAQGDYDDGEFGGMKFGKGNRSTRRKPAPAPLCPPQISHDLTRARTRAAAVGSQRLIAWAMARPRAPYTVTITWQPCQRETETGNSKKDFIKQSLKENALCERYVCLMWRSRFNDLILAPKLVDRPYFNCIWGLSAGEQFRLWATVDHKKPTLGFCMYITIQFWCQSIREVFA